MVVAVIKGGGDIKAERERERESTHNIPHRIDEKTSIKIASKRDMFIFILIGLCVYAKARRKDRQEKSESIIEKCVQPRLC